MSRPENEPDPDFVYFMKWVKIAATAGALSLALGLWGCPQYDVYKNRMGGQAEFERAEQNRRITIEEARAKLEAAKMLGDAEVSRAKGVAEANKIMAESLGGSEGYLRWRYIMMLEETGKGGGRETIYVPTEAMMPITEAGRVVRPAASR